MNNVYPSSHPLVAAKLTLLRNVKTDSKKFRELIREIAAMLAYEATMDLAVGEIDVQTPLMMTKGTTVLERIGLVPVLRAGLGMVEGFWELVPGCEVWHIGIYRDERTLKPVSYYNRLQLTDCLSLPGFGPHAGNRWIFGGYGGYSQAMGCEQDQVCWHPGSARRDRTPARRSPRCSHPYRGN